MSSFDPALHLVNQNSKIIASLGKLAEVFRVLFQTSAQGHGLSTTQLQLLHFVHFHPNPAHRKGAFMAKEFNVTKATVSDSLKALEQKGLVQKVVDHEDSRSYILSLTVEGTVLALATSAVTAPLEEAVAALSPEQKDQLTNTILELIYRLNQANIISTQRMCFNCHYYAGDQRQTHYCNLVNQTLHAVDLRLECPEFKTPVKD